MPKMQVHRFDEISCWKVLPVSLKRHQGWKIQLKKPRYLKLHVVRFCHVCCAKDLYLQKLKTSAHSVTVVAQEVLSQRTLDNWSRLRFGSYVLINPTKKLLLQDFSLKVLTYMTDWIVLQCRAAQAMTLPSAVDNEHGVRFELDLSQRVRQKSVGTLL